MKERVVALVALFVLGGGAIALFLLSHERVDELVFTPARGEARSNPVLAAERLLIELGYRASSANNLAPSRNLPALGDTMVLVHGYGHLRFEDVQRVLAWVENGGHAVLQIDEDGDPDFDPIFTPLGIRIVTRYPDFTLAADDDGTAPEDLSDSASGDLSQDTGAARGGDEVSDVTQDAGVDVVRAAGTDGRIFFGDVAYDNRVNIDFGDNETIWTIADEFGAFAGQIGYGNGVLTVASDLGIAYNSRIADDDNGYLLTRLLGPARLAGTVWLYYGQSFPSLWTLLWQKADFLIKALAALLLLYLWSAAQRFGPLIPAPEVARKAFMEHIAASGRFLWRAKRHGVLLASAQQEFLRDYARRHPAGRALRGEERLRHVARVCNMPVESVAGALRETGERSHGDFVGALAQLQTMWKKI